MSWAKLDDVFHSHAKPLGTSLAGVGVFALSLSWAAGHETDGKIPRHVALHLARGDLALTDELVTIRLWDRDGEDFAVHGYLQFNPSAKSLEKKRKLHAKSSKAWRARDRSVIDHAPSPSTGRDGTGSSPSVPSSSQTRFAEFYAAYPRHQNRDDAERAWKKLKPDAALLEVMLAAIERQRPSSQWTRAGGQYIPHPATWLNKGGWKDEPTEVQTPLLTPKGQVAKDAADAWLRIHKPPPPERLKLA